MRELQIVSAPMPSGMTWLINVLLELGVRCTHAGPRSDHWIETEEGTRISPAAQAHLRRHLPIMSEARPLVFQPGVEIFWEHRLDHARRLDRPTLLFVRDGRDAVYSHFRRFAEPDQRFLDFLRRPDCWPDHFPGLFGLPAPATWACFHHYWLALREAMDVQVVRFEDMREDALRECRRALTFLQIPRDDQAIRAALERSTFARAREAAERARREAGSATETVRRGQVGEWREVYGSEELVCFAGPARDLLARLGYDTAAIDSVCPIKERGLLDTNLADPPDRIAQEWARRIFPEHDAAAPHAARAFRAFFRRYAAHPDLRLLQDGASEITPGEVAEDVPVRVASAPRAAAAASSGRVQISPIDPTRQLVVVGMTTGVTWLVEILLALGIRATCMDVGEENWRREGDAYRMAPAARDLLVPYLPTLKEDDRFAFRQRCEVLWGDPASFCAYPGRRTVLLCRHPEEGFSTLYCGPSEGEGGALERWSWFHLFWLSMSDLEPIHVVSYERLRSNPERTLRALLKFWGIRCSAREICTALRYLSEAGSARALQEAPEETRPAEAQNECLYRAALRALGYHVSARRETEEPCANFPRALAGVRGPVALALTRAQMHLAAGEPDRAEQVLAALRAGDAPDGREAMLLAVTAEAISRTRARFEETSLPAARHAFTFYRDTLLQYPSVACATGTETADRPRERPVAQGITHAAVPVGRRTSVRNPADPETSPDSAPGPPDLFAAVLALQTEAKAHPEDADVHLRLGEALFQLGAREAAAHSLLRAAELAPSSGVIQNDLAVLFWEEGDRERSAEHMRRACSLSPQSPDVVANAAIILTADPAGAL